ncbi:MAG: PilZ domain-containing protein [Magnetococcus sp. YQC-9]
MEREFLIKETNNSDKILYCQAIFLIFTESAMLKIICLQKKISFESDLKLDISGIDEQHERLFILCRSITEATYSDILQIEAVLLEIESYISEHLSYEEQILKKSSILVYAQHKKLHDQFREQYGRIKEKMRPAGRDLARLQALSIELATLLQEWLCQHILKVDRQHRDQFLGRAHEIKQRSPRIKLNARALLELSGGRGLTCTVVDVSDTGALLFFQAVPEWLQKDETVLLHIIPLEESDWMACRIVAVAKDEIRIEFQGKRPCNFYSALVACKK